MGCHVTQAGGKRLVTSILVSIADVIDGIKKMNYKCSRVLIKLSSGQNVMISLRYVGIYVLQMLI